MPHLTDRTSSGFCVWFTGLSSAGKSTLAVELAGRLGGDGRRVSLFDGVGDPGAEREDRNANVMAMADRAVRF